MKSNSDIEYRLLSNSESRAVQELVRSVFTDSEGDIEGPLIGKLAGDLIAETPESDLFVYVALKEGAIVGSIFFSRMTFEMETEVFLLGPVAVKTSQQRIGIGKGLIQFGLESLKKEGVQTAITYGDPRYYSKLGFQSLSQKIIRPPLPLSMPIGWLGQSLVGDEIKPIPGPAKCVQALDNPAYW